MSRVLLRIAGCHTCRRDVLQSFVAVAGIAIPQSVTLSIPFLFKRPQKKFSSLQAQCSESPSSGNVSSSLTSSTCKIDGQPHGGFASQEQSVPWYLEAEIPKMLSHPLAKQQEIPPVPQNSPPILHELLQYISIDAGLDDLSLLDLRHLDPPPALGANVIMIIGTARSVKHLNVSADRLCRWLRSTHKLHPFADGLLGRNELKIKLRRKARRAKLASIVGSTLEPPDDGITTGWICVTVGTAEDGQARQVDEARNPGFVGFGKARRSTRIVVQMLTQQKRAEVDLEGLWGSYLEQQTKSDEGVSGSQLGGPLGEVGLAPEMAVVAPSDPDLWAPYSPHTASREQRRSMHTSCRRKTCDSSSRFDGFAQLSTLTPLRKSSSPEESDREGTSTLSTLQSLSTVDVPSLLRYLSELPEEEAQRALGQGPQDIDSTPFLRLFYQNVSDTSSNKSIFNKLELIRTAVMLQHPKYSKNYLFETFQEFVAAGGVVSRNGALQIVGALLSFPGTDPPPSTDPPLNKARLRVPSSDIELALKVLDHLSLRRMNILKKDFFILLYKAVGFQVPIHLQTARGPRSVLAEQSTAVDHEQLKNVLLLQRRLDKAMVAAGVQFGPDEFPILLRILFNQGEFEKFWKLWRKISLLGLRRSEDLYTLLFQLHAERGHQRQALECLSWVPMMGREDPPVVLRGQLARAVMACLLVADPNIGNSAGRDAAGGLPALWEQCLDIQVAEQSSSNGQDVVQDGSRVL